MFDRQNRQAVRYSDFAFTVQEFQLGFDRELLVQIFTYMDQDHDSILKFSDFVRVWQEAQSGILTSNPYQERIKVSETYSKNLKDAQYVSSELENYLAQRKTYSRQATTHMPGHNRIDNNVYQTITPKIQPTFGLSSNRLSCLADPFSSVNGGTIKGVMN